MQYDIKTFIAGIVAFIALYLITYSVYRISIMRYLSNSIRRSRDEIKYALITFLSELRDEDIEKSTGLFTSKNYEDYLYDCCEEVEIWLYSLSRAIDEEGILSLRKIAHLIARRRVICELVKDGRVITSKREMEYSNALCDQYLKVMDDLEKHFSWYMKYLVRKKLKKYREEALTNNNTILLEAKNTFGL